MNNLCCPKCGHDDQVQKVSSVITSQTWTGRDSDGDIMTRISELGKTLKASEPKEPRGYKTVLMLYICLIVPVFACAFAIPSPDRDIVGTIILMAIIFAFSIYLCFRAYRYWQADVKQGGHQTKLDDWARANSRWNNLYYCARDESIFVPGDETYSSLSQIRDYLYR